MKKVLILDIYRDSNYRISKDTNGGYGTENDFGTGIIPSVLSRVTKKSLFWPPLSALNLLSEFLRDNNFIIKFSHEINSVDHDVDYIFLTTSIVCSKTELNCAQRLRIAFPKIRIYAIGPFAKILQTEYNKLGVL